MVTPMFVVLDEGTERRLVPLVEASNAGTPAIPLDLSATLVDDEGLIVVRSPGQDFRVRPSGAGVALNCYTARPAPGNGLVFRPTDPAPHSCWYCLRTSYPLREPSFAGKTENTGGL